MVTIEKLTLPRWSTYAVTCPTRQVLDCVANKWAVLIIGLLLGDSRRFGDFRKEIGGVSQKMLTQTLRALERDGLVDREVFACTPPKVLYSLTPLGRSLGVTLDQLRLWAEENIEDVMRSRSSYDANGSVDERSPANRINISEQRRTRRFESSAAEK